MDITIIDVNEDKIRMLQRGEPPIYENGLPELLAQCGKTMRFTTDPEEAYCDAEVVMIAVPTPDKRDGSANLSYLFDVCGQIAAHCPRGCLVVNKSTSPVGTGDKIAEYLNEQAGSGLFQVAANPEFLAQGTAVHDALYPSRIVIGAEDAMAAQMVKMIYARFESEFVITDRRSAEMIKYASNDFLALKISYMNEMANLCEIVGADIETVALGMGLDPRIGKQYLRPGTGYGGSCFPKDTKALHWLAKSHDYELKTIKATIEVNETQKLRLFKKAKKYYKCVKGVKTAVLGLAFKAGTDDLREAPAVDVIGLLAEEGAEVRAWDPAAGGNFARLYPGIAMVCETIDKTIEGAELCLIMTEWDEVKAITPTQFARLMKTPLVIDGRNCYAPDDFVGSGVVYDSIGRKTVNAVSREKLEL
jgi:UDPglucose 6-dehydrogenase